MDKIEQLLQDKLNDRLSKKEVDQFNRAARAIMTTAPNHAYHQSTRRGYQRADVTHGGPTNPDPNYIASYTHDIYECSAADVLRRVAQAPSVQVVSTVKGFGHFAMPEREGRHR